MILWVRNSGKAPRDSSSLRGRHRLLHSRLAIWCLCHSLSYAASHPPEPLRGVSQDSRTSFMTASFTTASFQKARSRKCQASYRLCLELAKRYLCGHLLPKELEGQPGFKLDREIDSCSNGGSRRLGRRRAYERETLLWSSLGNTISHMVFRNYVKVDLSTLCV